MMSDLIKARQEVLGAICDSFGLLGKYGTIQFPLPVCTYFNLLPNTEVNWSKIKIYTIRL